MTNIEKGGALPIRCVKGDAVRSGAAALATVSAFHGLPLTTGEVAELGSMGTTSSDEEGIVLVMGRALGYEAVAMEGGYGDLPDVVLPLLVALRENDRASYAVLFAVEEAQATVGDPLTGEISIWTRDRFCAVWTGSVVQITPVDEERRMVTTRLAELRDPVRHALRAVGWGPPYPPRVFLFFAWLAVAALVRAGQRAEGFVALWTWLVAGACAGSLWSWLASDQCAVCTSARQLAGGLPLAAMGAALYAGLLAGAIIPTPAIATSAAIGAAVGAHAALVWELARAKVACGACLFVATCALGAAGVSIALGAPVAALAAGALLAGGSVVAVLPVARVRQRRSWKANAESLAKATLAEPRTDGKVHVVAFTRPGCGSCAFFHAAVKPALAATFGEEIVIEERSLGGFRTVAPIVVVHGGRRALFVGMPDGDPCGAVIEAVKQAVQGGGVMGELVVYDAAGG